MFVLNDFLKRLDTLYAENPKELEGFLKSGLSEARAWGNLKKRKSSMNGHLTSIAENLQGRITDRTACGRTESIGKNPGTNGSFLWLSVLGKSRRETQNTIVPYCLNSFEHVLT